MLITDELLNEINTLRKLKQDDLLQARLLSIYEEFKRQNRAGELAYVVSELAHFHTVSTIKSTKLAEAYHLELEALEPGAQSKWMTTGFYFALDRYLKVIEKVDEIDPTDPERMCRYSALTMKGQACITLNLLDDAERVLDELLAMVKEDSFDLPYGDEMNFMEAGVAVERLKPKCCAFLALVVPKIRDREFESRGEELLKSCVG